MGVYDTIVVLVVVAGAFWGWRKGLATQIASIASITASFFVAINFQGLVTPHIAAGPPVNGFAAFVILFVGTWFGTWLIFQMIRSWIESLKLKEFDYQMGALLGGFKGFLVASVLMILALSFLQEDQHPAIIHSRSGVVISKFLMLAEPVLPEQFRLMAGPFLDPLRNASPPGYGSEFLHGGGSWPGNSTRPDFPSQPGYAEPPTWIPPGGQTGSDPRDWRANSPATAPRY